MSTVTVLTVDRHLHASALLRMLLSLLLVFPAAVGCGEQHGGLHGQEGVSRAHSTVLGQPPALLQVGICKGACNSRGSAATSGLVRCYVWLGICFTDNDER
jgi:hypothetical protein